MKSVNEYSVEEVENWLEAVGLPSEAFKENAVDGDMLLTLTAEDLTGDLGLSNLQAKKFKSKLAFTKEISEPAGAVVEDNGSAAREASLQAENDRLKRELADLKAIESALSAPAASAPAPARAPAASAPAPARAPAPKPRQSRGPGVVGGAARGAAGGAVKGAIFGAILPGMDAGDGAAAGAAVGAMSGGLRGARRRRRFG